MQANDFPRVYALDDDPPLSIFRVSDRGRFDRWDPGRRRWVHMTSPVARDFYSRAIENGGAYPVTDPSR